MYAYTTEAVCSKQITFSIVDDRIQNVSFVAGCPGNLAAICRLVEGMPVSEVVEKLRGISCGSRTTSCADQLAQALARAVAEAKAEA